MAYDADDRTAAVAEPFGVLLTFAYDAGGNRSAVKDSFGGVVTTTYDALDRVVGREMGGIGVTNVRQTRSYTGAGMLAVATDAKWTGSIWQPVVVSTHMYDSGDRVTGIAHGTGTVDGYAYDADSRLTVETINGTAKTYAYDPTDQLTNDNGAALTYDLNGNRTVAGYTTGANNRMTSDGVWAYTYDAEGNVVKRSKGAAAETWVYGYDLNNRLVTAVDSATDGGAATARVTYVYDAIGNRIERLHWNGSITVDERFAQDGWDTGKPGAVGNENFDVVLDLDGTNGLVTRRLYGDGQDDIIAKQSSVGVVTWYLTDRLGSVQSLVDNSGLSVGTLAYSAFGGTTTNTGATDRYQYTGREADAALGLMYYRVRMYDTVSGKFFGLDQSGFSAGDPNLYRYVGNGPTNGRDPSGNWGDGPGDDYTPVRFHPLPNNRVEVWFKGGHSKSVSRDFFDEFYAESFKPKLVPNSNPDVVKGQLPDSLKPFYGKTPSEEARERNTAVRKPGMTLDEVLDGLQLGLSVLGLFPGIGEPADCLDGVISLLRGDYVGAGLSFAAMIPFLGTFPGLAKILNKMPAQKLKKLATEAEQEIVRLKAAGKATEAKQAEETLKEIKKAIDAKTINPVDVAPKSAYEVAAEGGKHSGFLKNYIGKPAADLQRGITSLKKEIAEHTDKIANPEKYIPDFKKLDPRQQEALLQKKWPSDIARQQEQLNILEGLLKLL